MNHFCGGRPRGRPRNADGYGLHRGTWRRDGAGLADRSGWVGSRRASSSDAPTKTLRTWGFSSASIRVHPWLKTTHHAHAPGPTHASRASLAAASRPPPLSHVILLWCPCHRGVITVCDSSHGETGWSHGPVIGRRVALYFSRVQYSARRSPVTFGRNGVERVRLRRVCVITEKQDLPRPSPRCGVCFYGNPHTPP